MVSLTIADVQYQVDEPVYEWMRNARDIIDKTKKLREAQVEYFKHQDQLVLRKCKAMESELDELLAGRTPAKIALQAQLFT
jgi:hypothetical protein